MNKSDLVNMFVSFLKFSVSVLDLKFSKINHIFISHLHGDHFYGLVGLISTFMLLNRQTDLHVYGPKGIKEIVLLQLRYSNSFTGYNLYFHELTSKESEVIYEDEKVLVKTIPLKHRIYTNGFFFEEFSTIGQTGIDIRATLNYLIVTTSSKVFIYNTNLGQISTIQNSQVATISVTFSCATVINEKIYIGTNENGLLESPIIAPTNFEIIMPDGPVKNNIVSISVE